MEHQSVVFAYLNSMFRILGFLSTLPGQSVGVVHHLVWLEHHPLHLVHLQGEGVLAGVVQVVGWCVQGGLLLRMVMQGLYH